MWSSLLCPCIPRRAASLLLCTVPGAPLFPAAVRSYSHSNVPCKTRSLAVFKTRVPGNETESRKSYGSIPVSLLYLPVCSVYTNHSVRVEEKPGTDSPRRVLNQRCYMRFASFIQILIRKICNNQCTHYSRTHLTPLLFIVTYKCLLLVPESKIKRRLCL